jgi:hypothetical protein
MTATDPKLAALLLVVGELVDTLLCFDSYVDPGSPGAVFCSRCFVYSICGQPAEHLPSCLVGRVLDLASGVIKSFPEGTFEPDCTLQGLRETAKRNGRHVPAGSSPLAERKLSTDFSADDDDAHMDAQGGIGSVGPSQPKPECIHCGPDCIPGAAHNARAEDGVLYAERHIVYDAVEHPTATELA